MSQFTRRIPTSHFKSRALPTHALPAQRLMSRKLRDFIPTAASLLLPQAASRQVIMRNTEERRVRSKFPLRQEGFRPPETICSRGKGIPEAPTNKQVSVMDLPGGTWTTHFEILRDQDCNGICSTKPCPNKGGKNGASWKTNHRNGPAWNCIHTLWTGEGKTTRWPWANGTRERTTSSRWVQTLLFTKDS